MAELFQPMLDAPSGKPAQFVRQPVADESSADVLKTVADTGMSLWEGYEKARLAGPGTGDSPEEVSFTDVEIDKESGTAKVSPTAVLNLDKIAAGRKQGKISAGEARILVTAAVKEASSRMPGMAEEFRQQAATFFGAYSPGWGLLEDEPAKKDPEQERMEKYTKGVYDAMVKAGMPDAYKIYGTEEEQIDVMSKWQTVAPLYQASEQYKMMESASSSLTKLDVPAQNQRAPLFVADRAANFEQRMVSVLQPLGVNKITDLVDVKDPARNTQIKAATQQWILAEKADYSQRFPDANPANREMFNSFLDAQAKLINDSVDGKVKADQIENSMRSYKYAQLMRFRNYNPGTVDFLVGFEQAAPGLLSQGGPISQVVMDKRADGINKLFDKFYSIQNLNTSATAWDGSYDAANINQGLGIVDQGVVAIEANPNKDDTAKQKELDLLAIVTKGMDDPRNRQNITPDMYKQVFNIYTKPDWKELKKTNPGMADKVEDFLAAGIDDYAVRAGRALTQWSSSNKDVSSKVELGVTSDGRMMFIPATSVPVSSPEYKNIRTVTDELNNKYQFGTMARAWSNVFQRPQADLLKELSSKGYFPAIKMRSVE